MIRILPGLVVSLAVLGIGGCSIFATRPVQDMSYTLAAIKAAKEVQADTYSPDYYRQANEWFFRAKNEYRFKNFKNAREYAIKARRLAEQAEFEAIRSGASRTEHMEGDEAASGVQAPTPTSTGGTGPYPNPQGTPLDQYDQRKADEDAKKKAEQEAYQKKKDEEDAKAKQLSSPTPPPYAFPGYPQPTSNTSPNTPTGK